MTIAFAPTKRVTTAGARPPCVEIAACPAEALPGAACVCVCADCIAIGALLPVREPPDEVEEDAPKFDCVSVVCGIWSGVWPTSCWSTGRSCAASACSRKTTRISVPLLAFWSRSSATCASRATVEGSPRSATELAPSTATTLVACPPPPCAGVPTSPWSAVAISRAPAFLSAITRVAAPSVSIRWSTSRTRRILSAKSATTIEFPPRLAVTEPCGLTRGRTVSTALCASIERRRTISVTNWLRAAPASPTRPGCAAAPSIGCTRSAPLLVGTATNALARSVERNTSKYSDLLKGRSVTTVTLPCTRLSMMNTRPVTFAASAMNARISASRTLSVVCAATGAASAIASAIGKSPPLTAAPPARKGSPTARRAAP